MKQDSKTRTIAILGILSAISVLMAGFIQFPILPAAPYLKYDPADVILLFVGFAFGPLWGLSVVFVTAALQEVFFGSSGWIGFLMHFLASGSLVAVSSLLYRGKKDKKRAILALLVGALTMVIMMIPLNLIFTPMYTGMPVQAVANLILPAILPFNIIKAFGNSILTFLLYKRLSHLIHGTPKEN